MGVSCRAAWTARPLAISARGFAQKYGVEIVLVLFVADFDGINFLHEF